MTETSFTEEFLDEQMVNYRPMSALALTAFVFLLIGCIAPILPILLTFDFLAIALAVLALFNIRRKDLSGNKLAVFTLVGAIFFVGLVPVTGFVRRKAIMATAVEHADNWLTAIQEGRFQDAHQLSLFYYERRASHVSYEDYYVEPDEAWSIDELLESLSKLDNKHEGLEDGPSPFEAFVMFYATPPYSSLRADHDKFKFTCKGVIGKTRKTAGTKQFQIAYDVEFPDQTIEIIVTMQRDLMGESGEQTHWKLDGAHVEE
jgi:hypothetical protein